MPLAPAVARSYAEGMSSRVTQAPPQRPTELPVTPREYHAFYRTPRFRWWHSLVALALFAVAWGAAVLAATTAAVLYEVLLGRATVEEMAQGLMTPGLFLANNVGVALAIPVAVVTHRVVFGQRAGWLFSVQGRLRWGLLGRFLLVAGVVHLAVLAAWLGTNGTPDGLRVRPETWFLLAVILLTTPLQAAGEEVTFRGLATRAVGSWFGVSWVGLVVATAVTAVLFMFLHGAGDLWLNVFYLCLAVAASLLTWRAGGLEAAVALHVVANLTTMLFLPFLGLEEVFDRGPGAGGMQALAQAAAVLLTTAALLWQTRRLHLPVRCAQDGSAAG
jgi:membrane protease YdiL (CAAX protease family)